MTATDGIPTGPITSEPLCYETYDHFPTAEERAAILRDTFSAAGIELGAYDERIAHWLADTSDWGTFAVITSWVQRAVQTRA
ncbi:hypothetical protein [Streptomyces longwoodensis]|uniref:hypothetical protein n=1 Tax=Streptomyces longwoodensis TaxID=68231 RepID=UPI00381647C2